MIIYFIRHGLTKAMPLKICCGSTDVELSAKGIAELKKMKAQGGYPDLAGLHVYTSGMKRTEQTLNALYGHVKHDILPLFKEIDFGIFEGRPDAEFDNWQKNIASLNDPFPNGESWQHAVDRAVAGVDYLLAQNEDALVVSHGGIMTMYCEQVYPNFITPSGQPRRYLKCGCGLKIEYEQGKVVKMVGLPNPDDFAQVL